MTRRSDKAEYDSFVYVSQGTWVQKGADDDEFCQKNPLDPNCSVYGRFGR